MEDTLRAYVSRLSSDSNIVKNEIVSFFTGDKIRKELSDGELKMGEEKMEHECIINTFLFNIHCTLKTHGQQRNGVNYLARCMLL